MATSVREKRRYRQDDGSPRADSGREWCHLGTGL
jgi:hypothetical protein